MTREKLMPRQEVMLARYDLSTRTFSLYSVLRRQFLTNQETLNKPKP